MKTPLLKKEKKSFPFLKRRVFPNFCLTITIGKRAIYTGSYKGPKL